MDNRIPCPVELLDTVVLKRDVPEAGLRAGDLGAIVEVHGPEHFEVEFVAASGRTQALVTLHSDDITYRGRLTNDSSSGYDEVAAELIAARERSNIGVPMVRAWARALPKGGAILDLGCGSGVPISRALAQDGFVVYGVDASPRLVAAFRERLPGARVACEAVQDSRLFGRSFDGIVAIGLLFLLPPEAQLDLIRRVGRVLERGGRFLFTAPAQPCRWIDALTGRESLSLGAEAYVQALAGAGFQLVGKHVDEGQNYCYDGCKR
jgi:SAM-dependent methyltransferase